MKGRWGSFGQGFGTVQVLREMCINEFAPSLPNVLPCFALPCLSTSCETDHPKAEEGTTTLRMMGTADVTNSPTLPAFMVSRAQGLTLRDRVLRLGQHYEVRFVTVMQRIFLWHQLRST